MSGICGFNFENKPLLKQMCDLITHRGPDSEGYFTDSDISIGIRRLSIIDLSTRNQPIHNENEDIWIICDGEIYNSINLKNQLEDNGHKFYTDFSSEIIIHAYEEWGVESISRFRGAFSFCIYDSKQHFILLARDHIGIKPLYYYFNDGIFIFGSEIKCILVHNIKKAVNRKAFNHYLSLRYVPFEDTLFKNIKKVPSSNYLIFDLKTKKLKNYKYWNFKFHINRNKTEEQLAKELKNLIVESIKIRLIDKIPVGALLSGGLDSSAVVGILSQLVDQPIKTYSISFKEGASVNETKFARLVSEQNNTEHTELIVKFDFVKDIPRISWHNDDLFADAAIIPVYLMGKKIKQKLNLVFTGDGADEIFAGYSIYYQSMELKYTKLLPKQFFNNLMKFYNYIPSFRLRLALSYHHQSKTKEDRYFRTLLQMPDVEKSKIFPFKASNTKELVKSKINKNLDFINQYINWDLKYQLPSQYNIKADRAFSATSLTGRIPFLDKNVVTWSLTIPSELKLKNNIEKYILRLAMKEFVPPEILKRKKQGFGAPINSWLITGLKNFSGELLEKLEKRSLLINPSYVKKTRKNRLKRSYQKITWNLMMFELWYETFIENDGLKPIKF